MDGALEVGVAAAAECEREVTAPAASGCVRRARSARSAAPAGDAAASGVSAEIAWHVTSCVMLVVIIGVSNVPFVFNKTRHEFSFVVANLICQNVLGLEVRIALGLISQVNTIIIDHHDLFQGLGKLPGKYSIVVDKDVQPVVCPTRENTFGT